MRTLSPTFAAHLRDGATTLCHGWRLTRRDGTVLGFTDHDRDIEVDGLTFKAASGFASTESTLAQGLAVTGSELSGALSSDALTADDLAAGRYDGATVALLRIDWSDPARHVLLRQGTLGEVRLADGRFTVEIRALSDGFNQTRGRYFGSHCDADLGDARCGLDLAAHTGSGVVQAVDGGLRLDVSGLAGFASEAFARGRLRFVSGTNIGFVTEVKGHIRAGDIAELRLWQRPPFDVAVGDAVTVSTGCDKRFSTCRDRFGNSLNFRGFPQMPGNDFVISIAVPGEGGYDGSVLE